MSISANPDQLFLMKPADQDLHCYFFRKTLSLLATIFVVLPITFANHLDPDQALPFVWPVLDQTGGIPESYF